jgi:tRNA dimethylallyltransferase
MQALGYKEIATYLSEECSLSEAVEAIKLNTRHFAKRQLTWFRREKEVTFMNYEDYGSSMEHMLNAMLKQIKERGLSDV